MNRRGFLAAILAAGVAPVVIPNGIASGILMPVHQRILTPLQPQLWEPGAQYGDYIAHTGIAGETEIKALLDVQARETAWALGLDRTPAITYSLNCGPAANSEDPLLQYYTSSWKFRT